jgi:hypothetical protein
LSLWTYASKGLSFGIRLEYRPLDGLEKSVPVPAHTSYSCWYGALAASSNM